MENLPAAAHPFVIVKSRSRIMLSALLLLLAFSPSYAQLGWPKDMFAKNGAKITVYQPQSETLSGNEIAGRAAFSVEQTNESELIFGVFWFSAVMHTDRDTRALTLESIQITDVKLPGVEDQEKITKLKALLEMEIPLWRIEATIDEVAATIDSEKINVSEGLNNEAPEIFYAEEPTLLLLFDGEPKIEQDKDLKMGRVINTPYLILKGGDDKNY